MMPWWAWSYLTVYIVMSCFGLADSVRRRRPWWRTLGNSLSSLCFATLILAFWQVGLRDAVGKAILLIFAFAFLWDVFTMQPDLTEALNREKEISDEERDSMENSALTMMFVLLAPGYIFGALLCAPYLWILNHD